MDIDYEAIKTENLRLYGEDTYLLDLLGQLYADRTHFIFEILQNAEDATATRIEFSLHPDRLEVRHDGRRFDENDVRGVCGVGKGTKAGDLTKIGRFGIGFKSVYAYTCRPEIHSGGAHFCIEHYVRPRAVPAVTPGEDWTTLFVFPFDEAKVSHTLAFGEIQQRLLELSPRTLLFLQSLTSLSWSAAGAFSGTHSRTDVAWAGPGRRVRIRIDARGKQIIEPWLLLERPVEAPDGTRGVVAAALLLTLDRETNTLSVGRANRTELVVFFPTEKETHLGFLIQGPYVTTPARDNVPASDPWNRKLVRETAELLAESLPRLRDAGLLSVGLLEAMPLRARDFPSASMFRPLYDAVRGVLRTAELLPTSTGGYARATDVRLARGTGLVDLFDAQQLAQLVGRFSPVHWLNPQITLDRTPELFQYLAGRRSTSYETGGALEPLVEELVLDPEQVARRLTEPFMRRQSSEWIVRLYSFLHGQRAVWPIVKQKPIIRLEDGTHTAPFDSEGKAIVYLPSAAAATGRTCVHATIAQQPEAIAFLRALDLREPDPATEIIEDVLPLYSVGDRRGISPEDHRRHLNAILELLERTGGKAFERLVGELRGTPFLIGRNAGSGVRSYCRPGQLFLPTPGLLAYLKGNADAWILDDLPDRLSEYADILGVATRVPVRRRRAIDGYVRIREERRYHERGINGFDPDCSVFGLDHALNHVSNATAAFIWNEIVIPNRDCIRGVVQITGDGSASSAKEKEQFSVMGQQLTRAAWLPTPDGSFAAPAKLSPDDLPPGFRHDAVAARALGMRSGSVALAANVLDLPVDEIELLLEHREHMLQLVARLREQKAMEAKSLPNQDVAKEIEEKFHRPGKTGVAEVYLDEHDHTVRDPQRRRENVSRQIQEAQARGPLQQVFTRVPSRRWESKDYQTRVSLLVEYGGRCQVCDSTFPRADGTPYFEGLYLASRLQGAWLDRLGNVLSLCPNCCAKLQFGAVEAEGLIEQIMSLRTTGEGGDGQLAISIMLLGEPRTIRFTERHLIDLQEIISSSRAFEAVSA